MSNIIDSIKVSGVTYDLVGGGGITSGEVQTMIDNSISGKTNQSDFSAHTANTSIHVTTAQTAAWDAKSNFSGSYNDLTDKPTIPTVPTSNTAFTNDAGYITSNDITGKTDTTAFTAHTADTTIHVTTAQTAAWNAKSDFSGSYNDLTNKLSAGTNITIVDNVISAEGGGGGGTTYSAGTDIDITNDVISVKQISGDSSFVDVTSTLENETSVAINTSAIIATMKEDAVANGFTFYDNNGRFLGVENNGSGLDVLGNTSYFNYSTDGYTITASTLASGDTFISISSDSGIQLDSLVEYFAILTTTYSLQDFADNVYGKFSGYVATSAITSSVTSASTDSEIPTAKAVFDAIPTGGTGASYSAGTNIDITNDTISCTLPISASTNNGIIQGDDRNTATGYHAHAEGFKTTASGRESHAEGDSTNSSGVQSHAEGEQTVASGAYSHAEGEQTSATTNASHAEGLWTKATGSYSHAEGYQTSATTQASHAEGLGTRTSNDYEHASGQYNVSNTGSTTADKTLFSVGNGTANNARHNAFEIRQNGDIYLTKDGQDVKLQDQLGGSYVTTDTKQTISGRKIFTYSASIGKAIEFKQTSNSAKVGFRIINSAETNNEVASFEFRPNTFTIDNVQHPLLYFGHYRQTAIANAGVPQTVIGFRQYDQKNAAAYHYLLPLPEKAKTPFSLTTSFKDYYAPIGFKNGSTMITADDTGVVDLSSELGGLKLKKLTQAEYDALATKDNSTLYVIVN